LVRHGLAYLGQSLTADPLTLLAIVLAAVLVARTRSPLRRWWAALVLGLPLHVLYVVAIGGDFMAGRFFSADFTPAPRLALAAAPEAVSPRTLTAVAAGLAVYAAALPRGPVRTLVSYRNQTIDEDGIADEKGHYHFRSSLPLFLRRRTGVFPSHRFVQEG